MGRIKNAHLSIFDEVFRSSYTETATNVASFIQSVSKKMEENGYTIISSDTNGQGSHGDRIFVTLIFAKK